MFLYSFWVLWFILFYKFSDWKTKGAKKQNILNLLSMPILSWIFLKHIPHISLSVDWFFRTVIFKLLNTYNIFFSNKLKHHFSKTKIISSIFSHFLVCDVSNKYQHKLTVSKSFSWVHHSHKLRNIFYNIHLNQFRLMFNINWWRLTESIGNLLFRYLCNYPTDFLDRIIIYLSKLK